MYYSPEWREQNIMPQTQITCHSTFLGVIKQKIVCVGLQSTCLGCHKIENLKYYTICRGTHALVMIRLMMSRTFSLLTMPTAAAGNPEEKTTCNIK
jgi:hypothetical protein